MELHKLRVLVIGYYNHNNLGDEQYKWTILYLLKRVFYKKTCLPEITFIDCDLLKTFTVQPNTMVILGGGDVLNHYFLDSICNKFTNSPPVSIIALSVGIPYDDIFMDPEQRKKLQILDHIFLRTQQDIEKLEKYVTKPMVHYLPDTSCFATDCVQTQNQLFTQSFRIQYQKIENITKNPSQIKLFHTKPNVQIEGFYSPEKPRKLIGIMWCRHIYHPDSPYRENYLEIVKTFASLIDDLIQKKFSIVMIPFNTKPTKKGEKHDVNKENDVLIQRDVMKFVQPSSLNFICNIEQTLSLEQTMFLYKQFYVAIPMRFHATLFSVYSGVPMIPIYTTKKIRNFLLDIQWPYENVLEKNNKDLPVRFDKCAWLTTFVKLTEPTVYLDAKKQLSQMSCFFTQKSLEQTSLIRKCMEIKEHTFLEKSTVDENSDDPSPLTLTQLSQASLSGQRAERLQQLTQQVTLPLYSENEFGQKAECLLTTNLSGDPSLRQTELAKAQLLQASLADRRSPDKFGDTFTAFTASNQEMEVFYEPLVYRKFLKGVYFAFHTDDPPLPLVDQTHSVTKLPTDFVVEGLWSVGGTPTTTNSAGNFVTERVCTSDQKTPLSAKQTILYQKLQKFAKENGKEDFRLLDEISLQQIAVYMVSYFLTNSLDSPYNHGLQQKMFSMDYHYVSEWSWVEKHSIENNIIISPLTNVERKYPMRFNLEYIDQNDKSGVHRSGWKYVFDNLQKYNDTSESSILLDLYVDRTFHWKRNIFRNIDIIPYTKPWIGFIHHTFNTEFTEYNNHNLLKTPEFLQSLPFCRGLIVLSQTLHSQFMKSVFLPYHDDLTKEIQPVSVYVLHHPTEFDVPMFDYMTYLSNNDKKIIHIGGWMRNIFSFYQLDLKFYPIHQHEEKIIVSDNITQTLPKKPWYSYYFSCPILYKSKIRTDISLCVLQIPKKKDIIHSDRDEHTFRKVILKGKNMNNYFPNADWKEQIYQCFSLMVNNPIKQENTPHISSMNMEVSEMFCSTEHKKINNNWLKHMMEYFNKIDDNIEMMEYVENDIYDQLLTKNIVFLNLVDGSAINTLLECLVRNTPIVVNRHPAVVEILGDDYPLFYDDISSIGALLRLPDIVFTSHCYLKKLDKSPYHIDLFLKQLNKIIQI